tara:strand:- start:126 stop:374 length:249 start_codon:yes stop_codon:yes gene_type:complete
VRGKKHLLSQVLTIPNINPIFSKWKVNEVTFEKSMEITDFGRERIAICRECPNYKFGICIKSGETMVLKVSCEELICPEGNW